MALVLIAEDEEPIRVLAESILQDRGCDVLTAANAAEALALLKGREVDLLFTEIHMSEDNGLHLAAAARAMKPSLKVLYTTGAGVTDGTRARMVEGSAFLSKPYRLDDLIKAVDDILKA
jgi:DNA-binding NtrC family response regulator